MARTFVCPNCLLKFPASTHQVGITVTCPACGSRSNTPNAVEDASYEIVHLRPNDPPNIDPLNLALASLGEWHHGLHDRAWVLDCLGADLRGLSQPERMALAAKLLDPNGIGTSAYLEAAAFQEHKAVNEDRTDRTDCTPRDETSRRETGIDP